MLRLFLFENFSGTIAFTTFRASASVCVAAARVLDPIAGQYAGQAAAGAASACSAG